MSAHKSTYVAPRYHESFDTAASIQTPRKLPTSHSLEQPFDFPNVQKKPPFHTQLLQATSIGFFPHSPIMAAIRVQPGTRQASISSRFGSFLTLPVIWFLPVSTHQDIVFASSVGGLQLHLF